MSGEPGLLFVSSALSVIVSPGPDTALLARMVLGGGSRKVALTAAAGMITAGALHATVSIGGAWAGAQAVPAFYTVLRWGGAAVLLVWGLRMLAGAVRAPAPRSAVPVRASAPQPAVSEAGPAPLGLSPPGLSPPGLSPLRSFGQGFLCTGCNPKVGLFLLAFLPQFVPEGAPLERTMMLLAAVYLLLGALWLLVLSEALHRVGRRMRGRYPGAGPRVARALDGTVAVVLIVLALRLWGGA